MTSFHVANETKKKYKDTWIYLSIKKEAPRVALVIDVDDDCSEKDENFDVSLLFRPYHGEHYPYNQLEIIPKFPERRLVCSNPEEIWMWNRFPERQSKRGIYSGTGSLSRPIEMFLNSLKVVGVSPKDKYAPFLSGFRSVYTSPGNFSAGDFILLENLFTKKSNNFRVAVNEIIRKNKLQYLINNHWFISAPYRNDCDFILWRNHIPLALGVIKGALELIYLKPIISYFHQEILDFVRRNDLSLVEVIT